MQDITDYPHLAEASNRKENGQAMWNAILQDVVNRAIEFRIILGLDNLEAVMERVGEEMQDDLSGDLDQLTDSGFDGRLLTPDEVKRKIAAESERLYDAFRPNRLDASGLIRDALRPVATNPATRGGL